MNCCTRQIKKEDTVALLVSTIRADPRMTRARRVRARDSSEGGGHEHEKKRKRVAGRKRCWSERDAAEGSDSAKQMSDEEDEGEEEQEARPSQRKKAKNTTNSGGGRYVSMKRALAVIQSVAHEHKECANLEQWVVTRWQEQRRTEASRILQQGEEGQESIKANKQTEGQFHQQRQDQQHAQQKTETSVVKRVRNNDVDKKNKQQQDKIMHVNVLSAMKSMKQMTVEQVTESLEKLRTSKAELMRLREQTTSQVGRDEEHVKQWLMTLDKHTFLLNDGALRIAKKRRTRGMRPRRASKLVGARQRLTARWVKDAVRAYLSRHTRLSIERAHGIAQQLEHLV